MFQNPFKPIHPTEKDRKVGEAFLADKANEAANAIGDYIAEQTKCAPPIERVEQATVCADKLPRKKERQIIERIGIKDDEYLNYVYLRNDDFDSDFDVNKNIIVGLTNKRIFKLENGELNCIMFVDIVSVKHQYNGVFSWDKVECKMKNGNTETIGIYHGYACKFFCDQISKIKQHKIE